MTYQILVLLCGVLCANLHSLPCVPYPREMGKGTWRFGATLCFSLSQGTHSPAERLLSSRELMQEKRWSQPPSAVQIPCSKGFNSVLTLDAVQSLGCWCHVRFTLRCLPPLWNSWGPANSFCGFHCSNFPVWIVFYNRWDMTSCFVCHSFSPIASLQEEISMWFSPQSRVFRLGLGLLFFCCIVFLFLYV